MLTITIASLLVGALLGQRFKVLILVPASAVAIITVATVDLGRDASAWSTALAIVLVVTSLQMGYLAGVAARPIGARLSNARAGAAAHGPAR